MLRCATYVALFTFLYAGAGTAAKSGKPVIHKSHGHVQTSASTGTQPAGSASAGPLHPSKVHLPSKATVVVATISSKRVSETFVPSTISKYASLTSKTTVTSTNSHSDPVTLVVGSGGIAWVPFSLGPDSPQVPEPSVLPRISRKHDSDPHHSGIHSSSHRSAGAHPSNIHHSKPHTMGSHHSLSHQPSHHPSGAQSSGSHHSGAHPSVPHHSGSHHSGHQPSRSQNIQSESGHNHGEQQTSTTGAGPSKSHRGQHQTGKPNPTGPPITKSNAGGTRGHSGTAAPHPTKGPDIFSASAPATVVTQNGTTATFRRETYSQYATLKGTTTITTSATVTDEDGDTHPTDFPVIVGPGGVHWTPT
ncbi:MAG: hypothetical protein Q9214_001687, partial [Letrouitia sp. 1 TL-2023]